MKKYINLDKVLDVKNYIQSLKGWQKIYQKYVHTDTSQFYEKNYNKYIEIIKPIIYEFSLIAQIQKQNNISLFTENFTEEQLHRLKEIYRPFETIQIIHQIPNSQLIISQVETFFQYKSRPSINRINLDEVPKNEELKLWGSTIPVESIKIRGFVIRGKGVGAKQLGMPTANIEVTKQINKKLIEYPNGIYIVKFTFIKGDTFKGVMSLGINPHYQNQIYSRKLQVYVYNRFQEDFYDVEVEVEIKRLIRFEGKFPSFDSFLNAMHNDIEVGKNFPL